MRRQLADLFGAGVGRHHLREVLGERDRGLAVAGGAVPRQGARGRELTQVGEQRPGIGRAGGGVLGRDGGEVISEGLQRCTSTTPPTTSTAPRMRSGFTWWTAKPTQP